jgi:hypothetical protein
MEFNLQKTIEPNLPQYLSLSQTYPHLSSLPGHTVVVPGVGNIISNPTFFVPLRQAVNQHLIKKSLDFSDNQEGLGTESNDNLKEEQVDTQIPNNDKNELNDRKRKLMDPAIFEAFNHPTFKSKTVILNQTKKETTGGGIHPPPLKKEKPIKSHNFQFL